MFGRDLILPSLSRAPAYDSERDADDATHGMSCTACGQAMAVRFAELLQRGLDYQRELGSEIAECAAEHFGIGVVGKAHDGGWPSLLRIQCATCRASYLVYAGVREPANGRYRVTVQGVTELVEIVRGSQGSH
jgi:hypothetical protein